MDSAAGAKATQVASSQLIQHWQSARQPQAKRTDVGVGFPAESCGATAFRFGLQLYVYLKSDYNFVIHLFHLHGPETLL